MKAYVCQDPKHSGDRLIGHPLDAFEVRLEARRCADQRGRKNVQLMAVVCKECLPFRLDEMAGRLPRQNQGTLL